MTQPTPETKAWHHPSWTNTYHRVQIRLSTHAAGNAVTALDIDLAEAISAAT